jgi:hypothetical protein
VPEKEFAKRLDEAHGEGVYAEEDVIICKTPFLL